MVEVKERARVAEVTGNAPERRGGSLLSLDTKLPVLRRERFRVIIIQKGGIFSTFFTRMFCQSVCVWRLNCSLIKISSIGKSCVSGKQDDIVLGFGIRRRLQGKSDAIFLYFHAWNSSVLCRVLLDIRIYTTFFVNNQYSYYLIGQDSR